MRTALEERRRGTSYNVVGLVEGIDPVLKNETIVFSAHYDHDGAWDGNIRHGADDNGSGTVGVLELARAFAASPVKPKRSLLFAIFAAEERGCWAPTITLRIRSGLSRPRAQSSTST